MVSQKGPRLSSPGSLVMAVSCLRWPPDWRVLPVSGRHVVMLQEARTHEELCHKPVWGPRPQTET